MASDWIGLSEYDIPTVADMILTDFTKFPMVPDRCQQGMLHALVLMRLFKEGNFAKDPAMLFNGKPVITANPPMFYTGNSQGGILGGVYMAVSTDVTRGVLGVPGAPYAMMLPRSHDFWDLFDVIKERYPNATDRIALMSVIQLLWDRCDPAGFISSISAPNNLPNTPPHTVIIHHALGDEQVTYVSAYTMGRSINAAMFEGNKQVVEPGENVYGFSYVPDNTTYYKNMLVTWDFILPYVNPPIPGVPEVNIYPKNPQDTHEWPRRQNTAQDMMYHFFITGEIINTCKGPCHGYKP